MAALCTLIVRASDGVVKSHQLAAGTYTLGREADCNVVIASDDVSRHHARLVVAERDFQIVDLGSTLGTKLNGQPLRGPQRATYPAMVQLGSVNISVKDASGEEEVETRAEDAAPLAANPDAGVPYVFRHEIARGGMGSILEAEDCKLGRSVAVKIMLAELDADELQKQRFINEAAVLGRLAHPNIVPIYDIGRDSEGQLYYSMKLVHGRTLQAILNGLREDDKETRQQYTLDRLLTIFRKVCDAMAFAHSRGIIHRDLKPENVMVGEFGEVLVMDWGLAKSLVDGSEWRAASPKRDPGVHAATNFGMTMDGDVMGTPQYMSPEQAEGRVADMDGRSDVFSLGGILYAVLTLRPPVEGSTLEEVLQKVAQGRFTAPSLVNVSTGKSSVIKKGNVLEAKKIKPLPHCPGGRVPAALSAVVMKALTVQRAKRYQKVAAFAADVEAYQGGFATSAEQAGAMKQMGLLIKRHKAVSVALAVLFLVGAASVTNVVISQHRMAATLAELRGTAPTFAAQAHALVEEGKLDEALAKIAYAIELDPLDPDYHLRRAHLLEASQRLKEAATAYRETLALDPTNQPARANLALCERLDRENGGAAVLKREVQVLLVNALLREGRAVDAGSLAIQLEQGATALEATLRARLREYNAQPGWNNNRVRKLLDGTFEVQLYHLKLGDLSVLRGMPISSLSLASTDFKDLTLLAGLPLTLLDIAARR